MPAFIDPPDRIPWYLRLGLWIAARTTGKDLLPPRLLAWYPKAAVGSGVMEALVAHHDGRLDERMLKLVRMQASFAVNCPFCVDMNAFEFERYQISPDEVQVLQGLREIESVESLSEHEKLAVRYARLISQTPLQIPPEMGQDLRRLFTEREIVILASTAAQVNYWARLIQGLGAPPAGFMDQCSLQTLMDKPLKQI
jgi:alkylhydroperoxidase family enzyme